MAGNERQRKLRKAADDELNILFACITFFLRKERQDHTVVDELK
jgi:hypothetical protein